MLTDQERNDLTHLARKRLAEVRANGFTAKITDSQMCEVVVDAIWGDLVKIESSARSAGIKIGKKTAQPAPARKITGELV